MSDLLGYSGTPLAQKLGLKDGQRALFIDLPASLAELAAARNFVESSRITVDHLGMLRRAMTLSTSSLRPVPCWRPWPSR